jgi:DNA-binding NarL/FixJ family response regulator
MNRVEVETLKLIVVDENPLFSSTLKVLLKDFNIDVVAQADSDEAMFKLLNEQQPDMLIYDLFMGSKNLDITVKEIRKIAPLTKILVLSFETDNGLIDYCVANGTNGFCDKNLPDIDTLAHIIRKIQTGKTVIQIIDAA